MFSFAMSITPGPNNLTMATSGLVHGFRRTTPALLGTVLGFVGLMALSGLGIGALVASSSRAQLGLQLVGTAYLLFLSYRLWQSSELKEGDGRPPLRAWHGAALQLVNPKAWMMAVTAVAVFVVPATNFLQRLVVVTLVLIAVSVPCMVVWTACGAGMRTALREPLRMRRFSRAMAATTAASAVLILFAS
jgi:threonine/homoserine/homoserine lactone efflux protein